MRRICLPRSRISRQRTASICHLTGRIGSAPLIFGDHRKPEIVVLPFALYGQLEGFDQLHFDSATQVMDRIETVIAHPSLAVEVVPQKDKRTQILHPVWEPEAARQYFDSLPGTNRVRIESWPTDSVRTIKIDVEIFGEWPAGIFALFSASSAGV